MSSMIYRRNPQTAGRVIDGLAFVVTPDDNKLHTLNATATLLWQLASRHDGCTVEQAADALVERYTVDRKTALQDAEICFGDLAIRQIVLAGA